ncbi:DUF3105 domain-containing protein [Hyalangium rubrum]|uniref:DUF3105 domain-containing protein n=1 Tax=Hyalangium rubrum TaxID=3103134 RepID=A0ABU5HDM1_9BACT|nr:DUF3105 domain-containing protein [Hyalangium sp. s54d21]MDY7231559.1 DUF3105 domain-containing protein [Hyalangium sp. s54d21]
MFRIPLALPLLLLPSLLACGTTDPQPQGCERFEFALAPEASALHVTCSSTSCGNGLNPPTAGRHCSSTLSCRVHDTEQPSCVWLHNLEHGHAVFLYNCPEGCPEEVAKLEEAQRSARRGGNDVPRALVAPDPNIPNRVAAILWRRAYLTDSADPEALRCLLALQDQDAPEPGLSCAP